MKIILKMALVASQGAVRAARLLWVLPCSMVGAVMGLAAVALGGSVRRVDHTLEIALADHQRAVPLWAARLRFGGITLGHVIVGQSHEVLAALRPHERVHVRQYERLGVFFFAAYAISSLMAWRRGQCLYLGNRFEQEAFALEKAAQVSTSAALQGGKGSAVL